ncbi:ABC transporter ATP-binding protein [Desulfobotulus mexicanus]|uniref:ABC transporter ATP-binding protein n=1 Tax=Desulfobotulus mexicanus TaxID=2586642 RepID=A0A5Q4VCN7_9BACT|nr:ABC transporter ATP-binding protein [Desulfobotulus mexicanus]TYT74743.1 ABC transporter ATP-binding protein [Desulfobotulus mexicanus]
MEPILKVQNLTMDFGGLRALNRVSLDIREGEIVALIGPNGAGKTTFFNCITGIYKPTGGDVTIHPPGKKNLRINGMKPNLVTGNGLARTFQNIRLFPNMTVLENVMIGRHVRTKAGVLGAVFRPPSVKKEERETVEHCYRLLKKVNLAGEVNELAKNLSYGAQRRLEIARAMATDPFLLLLDEPAAGMNAYETIELDQLIRKIRDEDKISILLIEHDMKLVMNISERIFVMDYGSKIAQGTPMEIKQNPLVIKAYLGEDADADH